MPMMHAARNRTMRMIPSLRFVIVVTPILLGWWVVWLVAVAVAGDEDADHLGQGESLLLSSAFGSSPGGASDADVHDGGVVSVAPARGLLGGRLAGAGLGRGHRSGHSPVGWWLVATV
jgi:hypothetical protein